MSTLTSMLRNFRLAFLELGLVDSILFALSRILDRISKGQASLFKYHLVAQRVVRHPLLPANRGRDIEVAEAFAGDEIMMRMPRHATVIDSRFRQGARCLVATKRGALVGFHWFIPRGNYREDEVRALFCPTPAGESAWNFDLYVDPQYRLGFGFSRLWDETHRFLDGMGITLVMSRISAFNAQSNSAHVKMGAIRLGSMVFLRFGPLQLMLATVAPYLNMSSGSIAVPVIELSATVPPLNTGGSSGLP